MNPAIASLIVACGIAGLLYLDREQTRRVSLALWIPGIWMAVVGSRSLSAWFDLNPTGVANLDGNPMDAALYGLLLLAAVVVLIRRRARTRTLLLANWAILIYFLYCLISVTWSDYPDVSLKRWVKSIGDLAMVLVIATDMDPVTAIRRTVSRIGFLLLPTSVLFILYFSDLGRGYTADGLVMNTGVTTNKNSLGLTVLVVSLVAVWNLRSLLKHKDEPNRGRRLIAQGVLLAFGLVLFRMADSSTCTACFLLGTFLMIATGRPMIRKRPARVNALCLALALVTGITLLLGGHAGIIEALGRDASMSGRTDIWAALISVVPNPVVGAGFESFWISPSAEAFRQQLLDAGWFPPLVEVLNEAHNGYLEIYLNLGWIGVCLIAMILIGGYRRCVRAFQENPEVGDVMFAFLVVAAVYSVTEAGFRNLNMAWIFLLLAVISASGVTSGLFRARRSDSAPSLRVEEGKKGSSRRDLPAQGVGTRHAARIERRTRSTMLTTRESLSTDRQAPPNYFGDRARHPRKRP